MRSLVLVSTIFLYGGVIAGGGTCGSDRPRRQCDGPTDSFDNYGICCDDRQKEKNEHGERVCNFSIVIPDAGAQPDGGIVECPVPDAGPDCEEDKIKVCVPRSVDAGEPDGGPDAGGSSDAGCWETIVVCPIGQQLVDDRCVDVNPQNVYVTTGCNANAHEVIGPEGICEDRNPCTTAGDVYTQDNTCRPRRNCPENMLEDAAGNCYDGPSPSLARLGVGIATDVRPGVTTATPGETNVVLGTILFSNIDNTFPAEVTSTTLTVLVADDPSGTFQIGADGSVQASQQLSNCRLHSRKNGQVLANSVAISSDGRLRFTDTFQVAMQVFADVVCDAANMAPSGTGDAFAVDVEQVTAVVADVGSRPALTVNKTAGVGSPPGAFVTIACAYSITNVNAEKIVAFTKASYSLASPSPVVTPPQGFTEVYRYTTTVSVCRQLSVRRAAFDFLVTDKASTQWWRAITDDPRQNMLVANVSNLVNWVGDPVVETVETISFTIGLNLTGYLDNVPAGTTVTLGIWLRTSGASSTLHDTIQVRPHGQVVWYDPASPPTFQKRVLAPDLLAAKGNLITF